MPRLGQARRTLYHDGFQLGSSSFLGLIRLSPRYLQS
jgi:hypothetical protein